MYAPVTAMGVFLSCFIGIKEVRKMKPVINFTSIDYDKKQGMVRWIPVYEEVHKEKYESLIKFMKDKGYEISKGLSQLKEYSDVLVVTVDNLNREVHISGPTSMMLWSVESRCPMNVDEYLDNYERIVVDCDIDYYYDFITSKSK